MQREGEDRRKQKKKKKEGWITFPYCMCSRIRHLGVPDVRHSHQTFQIKAPPHPSSSSPRLILSPSPPLSLLPLSLKRAFTHIRARSHYCTYIHTHPLTSSSSAFFFFFFRGELAERAGFMMFCNSSVALGCKTHLRAGRLGIVGYLI